MNLRVMPLKVQNKQSFMGMNFSNPQERARFIAQRQIETVVRAQQSDAFIKSNTSSKTASSAANSSSRSISFTSDPYPTVWATSYGESGEEKKKREEYEAFEKLETTDPLKWAQTWDYKKRKARYDELYKKELSGYFFESLHKKKTRAKYDSLFVHEHEKVTNILQTLKSVQDKVDKAQTKEDAARAQAKVNEQLKSQLELTERLKERINARLNDPNASINQSIAGYEYQKELVRDEFLAPVLLEKEYMDKYNNMIANPDGYTKEEIDNAKKLAYGVSIPPSVLFYGCFGTGKNTFARAIAAESDCYYEVFFPDKEEYSDFISRVLEQSTNRYLNEGKRTVAVINEAEKYINNDYVNTVPKNEDEISKMTDLSNRVSDMRGILDSCSKLPNYDNNKGPSAISFFFTTNYPKKMLDIGILRRAGRMPLVVPIEPAMGDDLKEVLKFHIKRVMPEESLFDIEKYDFSKILDKLKLSEEKGCYSNDRIREAMDEIRRKYDKNPVQDFQGCLEDMILNNKSRWLKSRDISPKVYEQYYDDFETIGEG